jgi:hypothetical protein
MKWNSQIRRNPARRDDHGYIMLTLLLAMAVMAIFAGVIASSIAFDIKRDREEELIHRGVQYSRAIRAYYKKFGRYPTKIEDLENTSNLRFLRKRYKDPMNCKNTKCADFKLLHFGEVQMSLSGVGGGVVPGANGLAAAGGLNGSTGFGQSAALGANSAMGANSNSPFAQNQQQPTTTPGSTTAGDGSDSSQPGTPADKGDAGDNAGTTSSGPGSSTLGSSQIGSGQIIGGPIIGVATTSKDTTIREFNKKKKYKDWVFIYDPAQDQGMLIKTPYQPQLQGIGQPGMQNVNGQNGQSGLGTGLGSTGLGTAPTGTQNNQNPPSNEAPAQPNQPGYSPQQQPQ